MGGTTLGLWPDVLQNIEAPSMKSFESLSCFSSHEGWPAWDTESPVGTRRACCAAAMPCDCHRLVVLGVMGAVLNPLLDLQGRKLEGGILKAVSYSDDQQRVS